MKRIAIVGGGISGLAAAFALEKERQHGTQIDYVIFESSARFGGVVRTERVEDCLVEAGPDSFLTEKPSAAELCRELGLGDQLIGSNDGERKTYMLVRNRLVPIPDGLMFMVPTRVVPTFFSPMFSWSTKLSILREWFYSPQKRDSDLTVADFVGRHYGREMVERVADPLLSGVYGGSADELSVEAVLPRFLAMEASHGSLGKAMISARKGQTSSQKAPLFTSLRNGMQQIVDGILARIPRGRQRLSTRVETVKPESGKWLIVADRRTVEFDAVIVSTPAYAASDFLRSIPELAKELGAIQYSSSVTLALAFEDKVLAALPPGFGFLVPRTENRRIIAATFVHNKFPHRAPENRALIRCFLGGTRDEAILQSSDEQIESLVRGELEQILGIRAEPLFVRVFKWKAAMAQYNLGHTSRIERIRNVVAQMPGLALAGNAYAGIGVPDCVRSGSEAAAKVVKDIVFAPQAQSVP
jgi:protoporphyrinogen/coproporphyrinogen III oxidase